LDRDFMDRLKIFLRQMGARWYSDHLCLTNVDGAQLHELIALPFNEDSVKRAAERIRIVQDILEMPLAVENVSAYATMPGSTMGEAEFVRAVVEEADCRLLLDVNNVFVNSVNFEFDPIDYIETLPLDKVLEVHVAGYYEEEPDLLLDTHAAPISDPVYDLFREAWRRLPVRPPVLLERDGNFPPLAELEAELGRLLKIMDEVDTEALELPRETHTTVL
ncbi:DUF692 family protein, partial [bacterium]|nr:DUF692 family protein [bacterium]